MRELDRVIVNVNSGEILQSAYSGDVVKITKKASMDYLSTRAVISGGNFFKGYVAELRLVLPTLSQGEKSLLFSIAPYVTYYSCHLQWSNGKDITVSSIVRISGFSKKTVLKLLGLLVSKDILYHGKNSRNYQWFVNPWIFSRGNEMNKVLKAMFKNYYIRVHKCRWKDLGDF